METCATEKNPQRDHFLHIFSNACLIVYKRILWTGIRGNPVFVNSRKFCAGPLSSIGRIKCGTALTSPDFFSTRPASPAQEIFRGTASNIPDFSRWAALTNLENCPRVCHHLFRICFARLLSSVRIFFARLLSPVRKTLRGIAFASLENASRDCLRLCGKCVVGPLSSVWKNRGTVFTSPEKCFPKLHPPVQKVFRWTVLTSPEIASRDCPHQPGKIRGTAFTSLQNVSRDCSH